MTDQSMPNNLLTLTTQIVSAHVSGNKIAADDLSGLIATVHATLSTVGTSVAEPEKAEPAVAIKKSVFAGHIVCLECGRKLSMLKRHLSTDHDLTPDAYRAKWSLPASYPMVAPDYAARRSTLAKSIGLGRKRAEPIVELVPVKTAPKSTKPTVTQVSEGKRGQGRPKKAG